MYFKTLSDKCYHSDKPMNTAGVSLRTTMSGKCVQSLKTLLFVSVLLNLCTYHLSNIDDLKFACFTSNSLDIYKSIFTYYISLRLRF